MNYILGITGRPLVLEAAREEAMDSSGPVRAAVSKFERDENNSLHAKNSAG